jgi:hypothetical protein
MLEGRELSYDALYASSNRYALDEAMDSGIENYMMPGHSTEIAMNEGPPGGVLKKLTVNQQGLKKHLLKTLGDQLLELDGSKMGLAVVLDVDGQLDSIQLLYSEPPEFAEVLLPELRKIYPLGGLLKGFHSGLGEQWGFAPSGTRPSSSAICRTKSKGLTAVGK